MKMSDFDQVMGFTGFIIVAFSGFMAGVLDCGVCESLISPFLVTLALMLIFICGVWIGTFGMVKGFGNWRGLR